MNSVKCHQFTSGHGRQGYGFSDFSRDDAGAGTLTGFTWNNVLNGIRYSQISDDPIFEIRPASASDFRHAAAFFTNARNENGNRSIYTHVLITENAEMRDVFGLLKQENFLTPEQFTQVTFEQLKLKVEDKDCTLPPKKDRALTQETLQKLGGFLEHYWYFLENREFPGNISGTTEIAFVLPNMTREERISFFADEIVARMPKYVQQAVSVSFGAQWESRGQDPCVCVVLDYDNQRAFPRYSCNFSNGGRRMVEAQIRLTQCLAGTAPYPELYLHIERMADTDPAYIPLARSYSVMCYCIMASMSEAGAPTDQNIQELENTYNALKKLAVVRYKLSEEQIDTLLIPLTNMVINRIAGKSGGITEQDCLHMIDLSVKTHMLNVDPAELMATDNILLAALEKSKEPVRYLGLLFDKRDDGSDAARKQLSSTARTMIRALCVKQPFSADDMQAAVSLYYKMNREGSLLEPANRDDLLKLTAKNFTLWQERAFLLTDRTVTGDMVPVSREKYIPAFTEIVSAWQNAEAGQLANARSATELDQTLIQVRKKYDEEEMGTKVEQFALLKPAEEKLLVLCTGRTELAELIARQCIRLRKDDLRESASSLADGYRQLLLDPKMCESVQQILNHNMWEEDHELYVDVFVSNIQTTEEKRSTLKSSNIDSILDGLGKIRNWDPQTAEELTGRIYPILIRGASKTPDLSDRFFVEMTAILPGVEQTAETMQNAYAVSENATSPSANEYLKKLINFMPRLYDPNDTGCARNQVIVRQLEKMSGKNTVQAAAAEAMDQILEGSKNQIPVSGQSLPGWNERRNSRINQRLKKLIESVGDDIEPASVRERWTGEAEKEYSCRWDDLTEKQLRAPVTNHIDGLYERVSAEKRPRFLEQIWKDTPETKEPYSDILREWLLRNLKRDYNDLWLGSGQSDEKELAQSRKCLDDLAESVDKVFDSRYSDDSGLIESIRSTPAFKGSLFMKKLQALNGQKVSERALTQAGAILEEERKPESQEFLRYLTLHRDSVRLEGDEDRQELFGQLLAAIADQARDNDISYWNSVFSEYGFPPAAEWSPLKPEGTRPVNILSFVTTTLDVMNAGTLKNELKDHLQREGYLEQFTKENIAKSLCNPSLYPAGIQNLWK